MTLTAEAHSFSAFRSLVCLHDPAGTCSVQQVFMDLNHTVQWPGHFTMYPSCGRAITSHRMPGVEQSRCAHTHMAQIPCLQLGPQSSGKHFSPSIMSDTRMKRAGRVTEIICGRLMMLSNISDHFHSTNSLLSMCHTPGRGWIAGKKI